MDLRIRDGGNLLNQCVFIIAYLPFLFFLFFLIFFLYLLYHICIVSSMVLL